MKKIKQSTLIPLLLTIYLCVMIYFFGMKYFYAGNYVFFFGVVGSTFIIIVALHFLYKRKERMRREREDDLKRRDQSNF